MTTNNKKQHTILHELNAHVESSIFMLNTTKWVITIYIIISITAFPAKYLLPRMTNMYWYYSSLLHATSSSNTIIGCTICHGMMPCLIYIDSCLEHLYSEIISTHEQLPNLYLYLIAHPRYCQQSSSPSYYFSYCPSATATPQCYHWQRTITPHPLISKIIIQFTKNSTSTYLDLQYHQWIPMQQSWWLMLMSMIGWKEEDGNLWRRGLVLPAHTNLT